MANLGAKAPQILLVEMDDETRPLLRHNLENEGFDVIVTLEEKDAIARMKDATDVPDLILLNQVNSSANGFIEMGLRIRSQLNFSESMPIVVIAEHFAKELTGQNQQVGNYEYIAYLEDGQQLIDLLTQLCAQNFDLT
ncbi:hypothetical protein [Sphaerothrix gracilis]|uniref:hypothetical protein n=1 Tax=Sphaerothrix gracilis TaxID=3151835 RepID=UPI0031FE156D